MNSLGWWPCLLALVCATGAAAQNPFGTDAQTCRQNAPEGFRCFYATATKTCECNPKPIVSGFPGGGTTTPTDGGGNLFPAPGGGYFYIAPDGSAQMFKVNPGVKNFEDWTSKSAGSKSYYSPYKVVPSNAPSH